MELNERIRLRRVALHMTQAEVAEVSGLTLDQVSSIERGRQRIVADWVPQLAKALGWTIAQLYGEGGASDGVGEIIVSSEDKDMIIMIMPGALERFADDVKHRVYRARPADDVYDTRIFGKTQQDKFEKEAIA